MSPQPISIRPLSARPPFRVATRRSGPSPSPFRLIIRAVAIVSVGVGALIAAFADGFNGIDETWTVGSLSIERVLQVVLALSLIVVWDDIVRFMEGISE